ncbi:lysoplasmalogenase [Microbulbifer sediminum]|uniref:lysoplasmalogenase n=1 Tax=Microbulbifer sediminum TaxID=2904250 RepID=UPI001F158494|nr:lysoplasmalogenase [Microbulbifer sediminum]
MTATTAAADSNADSSSRNHTAAGVPIAAFTVGAIIYIALDATGWRSPGSTTLLPLVKAAPILLLLWLSTRWLQGTTRILTSAALGFSALGDILLALDFPQQFVLGLGAFLVAQLTYAILFLRHADFRSGRFILRGLPVLGAALLLAQLLLPAAGTLAGPVTAYLLAILAMALGAAAHRDKAALVYCGALVFMASDALIGINRFVAPVPMAGILIMVTYYAAQLALLLGIRVASQTHAAKRARP